ncbi:MAG: hypothetical protein ACI8Q1_000230 [Parvicella sp.]|jgi:hypothetical protein
MKHLKTPQQLNEEVENLNISRVIKRFKWENKNGGKFGHTYSFGLRNSESENIKRIWSLALDDCKWENRYTLREVDNDGNVVMTWDEYLVAYES